MYPATNKYVDQQRIYNIIGKEILNNAWYFVEYSGKVITVVFSLTVKQERENHTR
jgi:hypothetical protein